MYLVFVISLMSLTLTYGQLSFHTDANTNSYFVKAPGSQQSFTKYFGGQIGSLIQQQQQPQQQLFAQPSQLQQQYVVAPQQNYENELQQNFYYQPQQIQARQFLSAPDPFSYQSLQQNQLQQQQRLFEANQEQLQQQAASRQFASIVMPAPEQQPQPQPNLLGVAYSPSTQVSHVKFSNGGGLAYNF